MRLVFKNTPCISPGCALQLYALQANAHTHSLTWAQRSGVFVGAVGAVIYAIAGEVCTYAELTLLTPELLAPMFWNGVFDGGDDEAEPVGVRAPVVRDVLERHEVAASEQRPHLLLGVATR